MPRKCWESLSAFSITSDLKVDVTHGIHTFKNRWRTLRVSKDELHALLKMNIAPLLELSRKFWETWEKKESGITQVIRRQSTTQFHPKKFIQVCSKQPNTYTVLLHVKSETGTLYQKEKAVSGGFQNGCHVPSLKLLTPELYYYFFIINFTCLKLTPWLYFNISTGTFAHLLWCGTPSHIIWLELENLLHALFYAWIVITETFIMSNCIKY